MDSELGIIIRAVSGTYDVKLARQSARSSTVVVCKPRGVFRKTGITPLVGDRVKVIGTTITDVLPRLNRFTRPPVANAEVMVLVVSESVPITDMYVLDTLIAFAEINGAEPIIAVNKIDLMPTETLFRKYKDAGFSAVRLSAVAGDGIGEIAAMLSGKICAFAGDTGVGKSSIINAIADASGAGTPKLAVGTVSGKLGRGRHTTRTTQLFEIGGGTMLIDAAGFAAVDKVHIPIERLEDAFREFESYSGACRFADCRHLREPGCAIREAVKSGAIAESRYASYVRLLELALKRENDKWK
ncbi:MAG: ribosome small subunit-dependent GTPase A [Oscillospiraceae bacterium]|jgi:ribosome biogenesis GTPase|nr:ribosome small subunit-dependent GTPase A [Oscillospiraceae bacterium]